MMMKYVRREFDLKREQESIRVQNGFFGTELTSSYPWVSQGNKKKIICKIQFIQLVASKT